MNSLENQFQIIIIDDEEIVRHSMSQTLKLEGYQTLAFEDPLQAIELCHSTWYGVVICDVRMHSMHGLEVLKRVLAIDDTIPVIMFSAHADIAVAIKAIQIGAYDFLEKIDDPQNHLNTVYRACQKRQLIIENRELKQSLTGRHHIENRLIGQTDTMCQLRKNVLQLAQVDIDIIIHGETGTGKEVVARCLHDFSPRADKPFVALNCGALSQSVIESELFGHEAGSFTGARKKRIGKIEFASGGTLFLDEIESMPLSLQIKLLRVIQERSIQRLGGNIDISIDIRIIAASKADLLEESRKKNFRDDLYYRLNVGSINIPPLDQRKDDIAILFTYFAKNAALRLKRELATISPLLIQQLHQQSWPGNIRELQNTAERWVLGLPLLFNVELVEQEQASKPERAETTRCEPIESVDFSTDSNLEHKMAEYEKKVIQKALELNKGLIEKTAIFLGIPRKKLYLRMKKHQLDKQLFH